MLGPKQKFHASMTIPARAAGRRDRVHAVGNVGHRPQRAELDRQPAAGFGEDRRAARDHLANVVGEANLERREHPGRTRSPPRRAPSRSALAIVASASPRTCSPSSSWHRSPAAASTARSSGTKRPDTIPSAVNPAARAASASSAVATGRRVSCVSASSTAIFVRRRARRTSRRSAACRSFPTRATAPRRTAPRAIRRGILKLDSTSASAAPERRRFDLVPVLRAHEAPDELAACGVGDPDDERGLHAGQRLDRQLDLARRDVRAAGLDHLGGAGP